MNEDTDQVELAKQLSEQLTLEKLERIRDNLERQYYMLSKAWETLKARTKNNIKGLDERLLLLAFNTKRDSFNPQYVEPEILVGTKRCQEILKGAIIRKAKIIVAERLWVDAFAVGDVKDKIVFTTESLMAVPRSTLYANEKEKGDDKWTITTLEDLQKLINTPSQKS